MPDSTSPKCPICGGGEWNTALSGSGFRVDVCASGCIHRTIPPPVSRAASLVLQGSRADAIVLARDPRSGHFRLAAELLDDVGRAGRLLDIGSGWGHLLRMALNRGYDALGIEASGAAADFAKEAFGVEVTTGSFPSTSFEAESFDVVTLNHVLEHIPELQTVLAEIKRILKPGGVLGVACPNYGSTMRWMVGPHWVGLQPSEHVWQLSIRSICELMRKSGLEPITMRTTCLEYVRAGRSMPKWLRLRVVLWAASLIKRGDNAIVVARKPF